MRATFLRATFFRVVLRRAADSNEPAVSYAASYAVASVLAALAGQRGGRLSMISTADGTKTCEIKLDSPPVFDGMSAADGKVLISLRNGRVACFAAGAE